MALKVGELYASFGIDTSGVKSSLGAITTQVGELEAAFVTLGTAMTNAFTRPLVNAAKGALKAGMDFDDAMSTVAALSQIDMDSADFLRLREEALDQASKTKYTATEVAEAMTYMALAGWDVQEMLDGLPGLLALGASSGEDLSRVSDILTDDLTAMGEEADQAGRFANIFAAASANSNTSVDQMGEAMKYVGAVAGTFGFEMEDVSLALGLMANAGIKGSQAGTALRRMLTNLAKPTNQVAEAMDVLGLTLDDGSGNAKSLYEYIMDLREVFGGWGNSAAVVNTLQALEEFEDSDKSNSAALEYVTNIRDYLKELDPAMYDNLFADYDYKKVDADFLYEVAGAILTYGDATKEIGQLDSAKWAAQLAGMYGMTGMLAIINATNEDLAQLKQAIDTSNEGDGSAFVMMQTQMNNLRGDIDLLKSAYEGLQISLSDLVMPTVRELVQHLTDMVTYLREMPDDVKTTSLKWLGFVAAIGPALTLVGSMKTKIRLLLPLIEGMLSPVGLITEGLLLFAAAALDTDGAMGNMLVTLSETAAEKLSGVDTFLQENIEAISGRMGELAEKIQTSIQTLVPVLADVAFDVITGLITALGDNAESIVGIAVTLVTTLADSITANLPTLIPVLLDATISVLTALANAIPTLATSLGDLAGTLIGELVSYFLVPENWGKIFNLGWQIITGVTDGMWTAGKKLFSSVWEALVSNFGFTEADYDEMYGEWSGIAQELGQLGAETGIKITQELPQNTNELYQLFAMYDAIAATLDDDESLPEDIAKYSDVLTGAYSELFREVAELGSGEEKRAAMAALAQLGFGDLIQSFLEQDSSLDLSEFEDWTADELIDWYGWTVQAMAEGIEAAAAEAENAVTDVDTAAEEFETTVEDITATASTLDEKTAAMYESLAGVSKFFAGTDGEGGMLTAIQNGQTAVVAAAESLGSETVNAALKSLTYAEGYTAGSNFVTGIVDGITASLGSVAIAAQSVSATFAANLSVPTGGSTNTYGPKANGQDVAAKIVEGLKHSPMVLTQDGKVVAQVNSTYAARAANSRTQSYALGWGK